MKFDVLNRFSGDVNFTADIDCDKGEIRPIKLGLAVKWGVKNRAILDGANLAGAILDGASSGINDYLKSIQLDKYPICYTSEVLQIGCEKHPINEWREFDDERIIQMDGKAALKFWRKYQDFIFMAIDLAPAKPTGFIEKEVKQ